MKPRTDRPTLSCCTPFMRKWPSGWAWAHSKTCVERRGQKVLIRSLVEPATEPWDEAMAEHPAGKGTWGRSVMTWLIHPDDCDCLPCGYVNAHLDDNDDLFPEDVMAE